VVAINLKQRRMYNLIMSCGRVLLGKLRHFFNYEKIITARMHARSNDDVDNKTSDEMTRKIGNRTNSNHSYLRTLATPPSLNLCKKALGSRPWCLKRLLMMPVCESMEECNIT
jgi:hypothetical protein